MPKTAEHAFKTIESDLAREAPFNAGAVLLFGEESYLVDHYERVLRKKYISGGMESLDCTRIFWEARDVTGTVSDIKAACDTLPMMSACRVVTVSVPDGDENSLGQAEAKALAGYVPSVPETAVLIISTSSIPKNSSLYKAISVGGNAYEFDRLGRADLAAFIRGRFKRAGVSAPSEVIGEIISVSGYLDRTPRSDLFRLDSDVTNIAAYAKEAQGESGGSVEGGVITMADVAACMGTSIETDVFAMLDAVSAGRKGDSLELLRNMTARGENVFGMLALLTGQFEIMLGYKELRARRTSNSDIMKALGVKSEFRLRKAAGFADRYDAKRIAELLRRLYRVDRDIKSGLYDERLALTMFVAEM
jgi:DNA polymerase III delta subunit